MDLSARLNTKPTEVSAPWERNLAQQLPPISHGFSIAEPSQIKRINVSSSHKKFYIILGIIFPFIVLSATLYAASYSNWPSPIPWHPMLTQATDQFITKFSPSPLTAKGSVILRAALSAQPTDTIAKHNLIVKLTNPNHSYTLNSIGYISTSPSRVNINTSIHDQPNSPALLINDYYQDPQSYSYIRNQQLSSNELINVMEINSQWIAIKAPQPYIDLDPAATQSLSSIRKVKYDKFTKSFLQLLIENGQSITDTGFESTHHAVQIALTPTQLDILLSEFISIYHTTVNTPELNAATQRIKEQTAGIFPTKLTINLLINKETLIIEHIYVETEIKLKNDQPTKLSLTDKIVFGPNFPSTQTGDNLTSIKDLQLESIIPNELLRDIIRILVS